MNEISTLNKIHFVHFRRDISGHILFSKNSDVVLFASRNAPKLWNQERAAT